jgi:broad specificity phosphatase PhoE
MHDPLLTPFGEEQCHHLAKVFPHHEKVDLLVASPLRRTLYTCLLGFSLETARGLKIIALPEAQETADVPCDTGNDPAELKKQFADKPVDFDLVHDGWNSKTGKWAGVPKALAARAKEVRQWLKARPEKEIVLVTHGGILHYITEDWDDYNKAWGM